MAHRHLRPFVLVGVLSLLISLVSASAGQSLAAIPSDPAGPTLAARIFSSSTEAVRAGDQASISGALYRITDGALQPARAAFAVRVVLADGTVHGTYGPYAADANGSYSVVLPASATAGITARAENDYRTVVAVGIVDAAFVDASTLSYDAQRPAVTGLTVVAAPTVLVVQNKFVSSVGWVKPGESYPFRVFVRNYAAAPASGVSVTIPAAAGCASRWPPVARPGSAGIAGDTVTWTVGPSPGATDAGPATAGRSSLAKRARRARPGPAGRLEGPLDDGDADLRPAARRGLDQSHGPKVIPPGGASTPPASATGRSRSSPSTTSTASTSTRATAAPSSRQVVNSPDGPGLDLQPLPGDVLRPALPARHRAVGGDRHRGLVNIRTRKYAVHGSSPTTSTARRPPATA